MSDISTDSPIANGNIKATKQDWINAALDALISDGVESVRVQTLGHKLGVSRSSFYWYFKSRQDLLDQLLDYWRVKNTRVIVERTRRPSRVIVRGVLNVFECWVNDQLFDPRLDFAIRAWSRKSGSVRRAIDQADDERVDAIRQMFARHGYSDEDAFVRARVLYYMQIGYYALELRESMESRLSHVEAYLRAFTGEEPARDDLESFRRHVQASATSESS
ncbi:TetR/AcrR family transcriptional regulator [Chelativorans xinjiangense]|uniref:TetR/AcrR family transcriptional regulator n=1 Tax=Chelativorans xinjiangense TaxID=2681485 RepID=UPI00135ACA94|nr:TetR/AcrR family transcriptional regulator [Chelativorans xinjiangense]